MDELLCNSCRGIKRKRCMYYKRKHYLIDLLVIFPGIIVRY